MAIEEFKPEEILREARRDISRFLREIRGRRRAIKPRIEFHRRWIEYYKALSRVKPLTKEQRGRLEFHRRSLRLLEARIEILRAAGRYARKPTGFNLEVLRMAQSKYRMAKIYLYELARPEEARRLKAELPERARRVYEEIKRVQKLIEEKCKEYREVAVAPEIPLAERSRRLAELGAELQKLYIEAYELKGWAVGWLAAEWAAYKRWRG